MDAPFCKACLLNGLLSHTYKVSGRAEFKCGSCKKYSVRDDYEQIDFEWRSKFEEWKAKLKGETKKTNVKIDQESIDRVEKVAGG